MAERINHPAKLEFLEKWQALEKGILLAALTGLFITASLGILLRAFPFLDQFPLSYKNVLHGHSHFAFGGWVMPAILILIWKLFPEAKQDPGFRHWKNISCLLLFSAYGMLFTFPFFGYKLLSILFSTIQVGAGFYLAWAIWKIKSKGASFNFLKAGSLFLVLSALGPFATGPLIALGQQGSPLYYNSIYFYLHFQINGWFSFLILACIYRQMENAGMGSGNASFWWFTISTIPAYFLSVLWNGPPVIYYIIGGIGAVMQFLAFVLFLKQLMKFKKSSSFPSTLLLPLIFYGIKISMQVLTAFPLFIQTGLAFRGVIIAYLHLTLLGVVSLYFLNIFPSLFSVKKNRALKLGQLSFLIAFISTEILLFLPPLIIKLGLSISFYSEILLLASLLFLSGVGIILIQTIKFFFPKKLSVQFSLAPNS